MPEDEPIGRRLSDPNDPLHSPETRIIGLRPNFTGYDAASIALAETLGQPQLTIDAKFARAPGTVHSAHVEAY